MIYVVGGSAQKSTMGKVKNTLGLARNTKIANKSDQKITVIISYQAITVRTKVQAGVSILPYTSLDSKLGATLKREDEIQKGEHPPQQSVVLPNSREAFELPWKDFYLTILTERMDGSCLIHEKNRMVRSSQNWIFLQTDLAKHVAIQRPSMSKKKIKKKKLIKKKIQKKIQLSLSW
jgi:hypothetical protein